MSRSFFLSFILLLLGLVAVGCDYLAENDECYPIKDVSSCSEYDDALEYCDADENTYAVGCHVEEKCDGEGDDEKCKRYCVGEIVPCDVMGQDECTAAVYCEWYNDPNHIEEDF